MNFKISGLPVDDFRSLLQLPPPELAARGVSVCSADAPGAYPCRVTLEDASPGEELLLLSYAHLRGETPCAATGPIFVRRKAAATQVVVNAVPEQQRSRLLSVRAYDASLHMMDAEVAPGDELESLIRRFFADSSVSFLHVHNARRGCYACRVDRA